jgi:hypothetical protein
VRAASRVGCAFLGSRTILHFLIFWVLRRGRLPRRACARPLWWAVGQCWSEALAVFDFARGRVSHRFAGVAFWFAFEQGWSEAWSVIRHECKARWAAWGGGRIGK